MAMLEDIATERDSAEREQFSALQTGTEARPSRRDFGEYLSTMGIFLLLLYCAPFYLVRRPDFEQRSNSPYTLALNYAFKMADQNADVVLFGDSTALHGLDPSRMSRELGVKTINLPNTAATLRVMNDLSLKRYLKTNRPPRLIVFYFAAWDMDYRHTELPIGNYEGLEVLAHRGTLAEILSYAWSHPRESLEFPFHFYLANSSLQAIFKRQYSFTAAEVARTGGHLSNPATNRLSAQCEFWAAATNDIRFDSVKALGETYGSSQTRILYFVAPIPGCRNASAVVNRDYSELPAAPPRELPLEDFRGSAMYLHPSQSSVAMVTDQLVEAVRPILGETKPLQPNFQRSESQVPETNIVK